MTIEKALPESAPGPGRILIFVHDFRASGVVRNTLALAARLAEEHEVTLVARHDEGLLAGDARHGAFNVSSLSAGGLGLWAAAIRLRRLVQRVRPDVLLSTGNRGHWVARLALIGLRRPLLVLRLSNSMDAGRKDFGLRSLSARLLAARADKLFIVGAATGASPALAQQIASGRAQAIPNGVDRERANRLATAPPPPNYPGTDRPIVLSIGRLAPQKDFPTLVRAAAIASAKVPLRLVIVGKGDEQAQRELRAVAAAAGLDEEVFRLGGETDNVFAWLSRAAVFVLPSRWEGSSVALLEALAINVPVVATRQAGDARDVLDNGRYGLLVEAGDAEAMAAAILRQLSPERIRPGNRVSHYTVEAMLDLYAEGVNSALDHARRER